MFVVNFWRPMLPQLLTDCSGNSLCKMGRLNIYTLMMCLLCLCTQQQIKGGPIPPVRNTEYLGDPAWWGRSSGVALIVGGASIIRWGYVYVRSHEQGLALTLLKHLCCHSSSLSLSTSDGGVGGMETYTRAGGRLGRRPAAQAVAKPRPTRQDIE